MEPGDQAGEARIRDYLEKTVETVETVEGRVASGRVSRVPWCHGEDSVRKHRQRKADKHWHSSQVAHHEREVDRFEAMLSIEPKGESDV